jgi:phenylacetate-coenzyme A ligase PaaK-like adenylate-forming protein
MRRIDHVVGRTEFTFTYTGGVRVHPLAIEAPLDRHRHVVEYQVIQTERGVRVRFCANGPVDSSEVSASIETALRGCGLALPEVSLEQVPELSRQASGKLKRFVPLATSS